MTEKNNWNKAGKWYTDCVGEKGHYYHQSVVIPGALRLLQFKKGESLLDLGCGQGVFYRHLPPGIDYIGIDNSSLLIEQAKRLGPARYIVGDATEPLSIEKSDFDAACFILSLQNMAAPERAIAQAAAHLKPKGRLLLILNHPCFRIPRQSHWGVDEEAKLQYRRLNLYMTPQSIPIQTNPGKKDSAQTFSYHHPLSSYAAWLAKNQLAICSMEEWCSDKQSEGGRAKMEDRARKEFPLFMAILAQKGF